MKRLIAGLLAVLMLLSVAGCGGSGSAAGVSKATWITYEEAGGEVKSPENKNIFVYSYQQPIISTVSEGAAMINTKLDNATTAFFYGSGGVQELTDLANMDWQESWFACYALDREVSVARIDEAVASFRYSDYAFTGGVHGYTGEYGLTYDMVSGTQLRLEDLTHDEWALKQVCRQHITGYLESDEFADKEGLFPDYQSSLETVLNNWVLTQDGLQFIAQPYIIAPYAVGTLRFTVPYSKIAHVVDKKWMPEAHTKGNGVVEIRAVDMSEPTATNFTILEGGQNLVVQVTDTIYDFSVEEVNSYLSGGDLKFYVVRQHLYSPEIRGEMFGLNLPVPEGAPTMLLRYRDGAGEEHQYYVTYDGQNGGTVLVPADPPLVRE